MGLAKARGKQHGSASWASVLKISTTINIQIVQGNPSDLAYFELSDGQLGEKLNEFNLYRNIFSLELHDLNI